MAQYSCKWNTHASNMLTVMDNLKAVENFVDVTLVSEGRVLKAHKLVLSTCSTLFHQMFLTNPCSHPVIILQDVKYTTLKSIIDFIYKGEISFQENELELLLKAGKALEIKGLTDICKEQLISQATDKADSPQMDNSENKSSPLKYACKKRKRTHSDNFQVQFDDATSKQEESAAGDHGYPNIGEVCTLAENDSRNASGDEAEHSSAESSSENPNVRIKQVLRSLCSAKRGTLKEKRKILGECQDKRTSYVWNFFTPVDNNVALCKTCKKNISRKSSITNLKKHLQSKHPSVVLQSFLHLKDSEKSEEQEFRQGEEVESKQREGGTMPVVVPLDSDREQVIFLHEEPDGNETMPIILKF